jgi:ribosomal protein S18 acetylase RimI-like enzyme
VEIRPLTEAHAEAWRALRLRMLREHPDVFGSSYEEFKQRPLDAIRTQLREQEADPDRIQLGAFVDGSLVASAGMVRERGAKDRHRGFVWGVYTAPEARGRGASRALIEEIIRRAKALPGMEQLTLAVTTHNTAARNLYVALGFERYGTEIHALKLGDTYVDEDLMVLWLHERP